MTIIENNKEIVFAFVIGWTFFWTWVNLGRMYYKQTVSARAISV